MVVQAVVGVVIPALVLRSRAETKRKQTEYWEKQGYDLLNPVFYRRLKKAQSQALVVYVVSTGLLAYMTRGFSDMTSQLITAIFGFVLGYYLYVATIKLSIRSQERGRMDSGESLERRDKAFVKRQQPLAPDASHGSSVWGSAHESGLADDEVMAPARKGGE